MPEALAQLSRLGEAESTLRPAVAQKLAISEQIVALRRKGAGDGAKSITASGNGKAAMDTARFAIAGFRTIRSTP